jgi:hypothetical protein
MKGETFSTSLLIMKLNKNNSGNITLIISVFTMKGETFSTSLLIMKLNKNNSGNITFNNFLPLTQLIRGYFFLKRQCHEIFVVGFY